MASKEKNVDPYCRLFYRDWLESESIMDMSLAAEGLYARCLAAQAARGNLPSNLSKLARLISRTQEEVEAVWPEVAPHFVTEVDDNGEVRLYNEKQRDLISEAKSGRKTDGRGKYDRTKSRTDHKADHKQTINDSKEDHKPDHKPEHNQSINVSKEDQDADHKISVCGVDSSLTRANASASASVYVSDYDSVLKKGSGEKTDSPPLVESEASALASRFLEIRQAALKTRPTPGERIDTTAMFAELLETNTAQDIGLVLKLLGSARGRKHWQYGLGNRVNAGSKKPHPLVTTFGSMLAATDEFMPSKGPPEPERQKPPEFAVVPPILPADLQPFSLELWAGAIAQIEQDPEEVETWLKPVKLLGQSGDELWLSAPSNLSADNLRHNYAGKLTSITGYDIRVVVVDPQ